MGFDLRPTEEQSALRDTLRTFSSEVLRPAARDCEAAKKTSDEIATQIQEIGVAAPLEEAYGGAGLFDCITHCIVAEELAWGDPGIAYQALGSGLAATVIGIAGTDEQKSRLLPAFAESAPAASFVAIAEKIALADLGALETTVDSDKVTGTKYGVLNYNDASFGIAVGRGPDDALGAVIIEPGSYEVVKPEDKLGLEAAPTAVVRFDGEGDALPTGASLEAALARVKLITGAIAVGCARASLEYASEYATEREAFGKPIGAFQAISFKIADMATELEAARLAIWKAAWDLERGAATVETIAKANGQALSAAVHCGDDGVQILGGHGYIRDHLVEKWFRDAVTLSVLDTPEALGDVMVGASAMRGA